MEYRSGVESNFGVSKILITPAYSVWAQCILWSGVLKQSCGVESDFGVAKAEWRPVVMCVCVAKFYVIL